MKLADLAKNPVSDSRSAIANCIITNLLNIIWAIASRFLTFGL
ncbi:hypothetical protein [Microcoleus sp. bin38.metabat.b11b12b14.051]|nr:hypothetical protein [Microcoleus sp. bin38.metabat.b11b12b14.051]